MRRFSRTVSSGKISVIWKVRAMPRQTRRAGSSCVMSSPSNRMRPEVGVEKSADQIEEGGLAGAVGADHRAQLAGLDRHRDVVDGDQAAEMARDVLDLEQAHDVALRRMMPSTPRGKNSTTSTKNSPMNDIQFSVWLEM